MRLGIDTNFHLDLSARSKWSECSGGDVCHMAWVIPGAIKQPKQKEPAQEQSPWEHRTDLE